MRRATILVVCACLLSSPLMGADSGLDLSWLEQAAKAMSGAEPQVVVPDMSMGEEILGQFMEALGLRYRQVDPLPPIDVFSAAELRAQQGSSEWASLRAVEAVGSDPSPVSASARRQAAPRRPPPPLGGTAAAATTGGAAAAPAASGARATVPAVTAPTGTGMSGTTWTGPTVGYAYNLLDDAYGTGNGVVLSAAAPSGWALSSAAIFHAEYTGATTVTTQRPSVVQFTHPSTSPIPFVEAQFCGLPTGLHTYLLSLGSTYSLGNDRVQIRLENDRAKLSRTLGAPKLVANPRNLEIRALFTFDAPPGDPGLVVTVLLRPTGSDRPGSTGVTRQFHHLQLVRIDE